MKILHILYSGLGGHGSIFFSFVKEGNSRHDQCSAIFNGIEPVKQEYIDNCKKYDIPWDFVSKKPGVDIGYYRQLIKKIRHSDADIIFLHSSAYILPARLGNLFTKKKKKIVIRETQANHLKVRLEWMWLRFSMLTANRIVFLSEAYRDETQKKLGWFYRSRRVSVIPNGLDLDLYKPKRNTVPGKITIGMQSRLVKLKDHLTLLEAFSLLLHSQPEHANALLLKIAGDGDFRQQLADKATSLQLSDAVEFTGMLEEQALLDFLWSLDIYVHASLGETMSTAIMQAMACGLPVIASNVKGISNMIDDGVTGLLVPERDPVAMCKAMEQLINDQDKRGLLSTHARAYAEIHFADSKMINAYQQLFEELLKSH